jgi:hypothetical protein
MDSIPALIERVKANGHKVLAAGPQPEAAIVALEAQLGVRLPHTYRRFLREHGAMAIYDCTISGIFDGEALKETGGSVYGDTLRYRREWDLPAHLLVIQVTEDAPYCLDMRTPSADGEFPVVYYGLVSKRATRIASDFDGWMRRYLLQWSVPDTAD